jgi:hypothetical protein
LFGTLHDRVLISDEPEGEGKVTKGIDERNNPGSADCDSGIAEEKGWQMIRSDMMVRRVGH